MDPNIRKRLRDILAKFYPDEPSIRRVAADAAIDLSRVPLNNSSVNNWHKVLSEAEFVNQLDALLDVVEEEYAANETLQRICDAYRHAIGLIPHEHLVSHIERVGEQLSESQAHGQDSADHEADQSSAEATARETFQIENAVRNHSDFTAMLKQSDFVPREERNGRELIVVRPKVAVTCTLPIAISGGSCHIEFSDPFLRKLGIFLEHKEVLENLVIGRHTPFDWNAREFIKVDNDGIWLSMGRVGMGIALTKADATELCECVDRVVDDYISTMLEAENTLEAWNRPFVPSDCFNYRNEFGYELLTVSVETWERMLQCAKNVSQSNEIEYRFDTNNGLSVGSKVGPFDRIEFHAHVEPKPCANHDRKPDETITLIYMLPVPHVYNETWQDSVGIKGLWTAGFTKQWLLKKFLPMIQNHEVGDPFERVAHPNVFWKINDPHLFLHHIVTIRRWAYAGDKSTTLLVDYCEALNQLLRIATIEDQHGNSLSGLVKYLLYSEALMKNEPDMVSYADAYYERFRRVSQSEEWLELLRHRDNIIALLSNHLTYLRQLKRIDYRALDYLFNAHEILFLYIKINTTQTAINMFKKALWPLFERANFEIRCRHINED